MATIEQLEAQKERLEQKLQTAADDVARRRVEVHLAGVVTALAKARKDAQQQKGEQPK